MLQPPADAKSILHQMHLVQLERDQRRQTPGLGDTVNAVKAYQQRRFAHSHSDFFASSRYGPASRFFLSEVYGPGDFSTRDTQFSRVVPALVRLFPQEIVNTVQALAQLHALSESLDTGMGLILNTTSFASADYARAWQTLGRAVERETQIGLTVHLGESLDRLTRKPLLRHSLRMMRGPAKVAGLEHLQALLEAGFDAFQSMNGARDFLGAVAKQERSLSAALFAASADDLAALESGTLRGLLPSE